jgi:hypothetical protein
MVDQYNFPIEIYCMVATYIDENTWRSWIFVCREFVAMLPKNCRPRRTFFTGYINADWLNHMRDRCGYNINIKSKLIQSIKENRLNWTDDCYYYEIEKHYQKIKLLRRAIKHPGPSINNSHPSMVYKRKIRDKYKKIKYLKRKKYELKHKISLQPDLNPIYIKRISLIDFRYITGGYLLMNSFYKEPITVPNLLNNLNKIGNTYPQPLNREQYPYLIDVAVVDPYDSDHDKNIEMFYNDKHEKYNVFGYVLF